VRDAKKYEAKQHAVLQDVKTISFSGHVEMREIFHGELIKKI
jgi:fatty acid/phospholipid biosynthesis enzyme